MKITLTLYSVEAESELIKLRQSVKCQALCKLIRTLECNFYDKKKRFLNSRNGDLLLLVLVLSLLLLVLLNFYNINFIYVKVQKIGR